MYNRESSLEILDLRCLIVWIEVENLQLDVKDYL